MIQAIGVIGSGTMGNGIAQTFAQRGFDVRLVDVSAPALDKAKATIDKSLAKFVEKGTLSAADRDATLSRLHFFGSIDHLAEVDYVVEAIVEQRDAKRDLFAKLDALVRPEVVLSSNTSSISITDIAAATRRPGARARDALHESRAADDAGGVDPRAGDVGCVDGSWPRSSARASGRPACPRATTPGSLPTGS